VRTVVVRSLTSFIGSMRSLKSRLFRAPSPRWSGRKGMRPLSWVGVVPCTERAVTAMRIAVSLTK
jgi:hypothetical protein